MLNITRKVQLISYLEKKLQTQGYEVVDIEVTQEDGWVLRLYIDRGDQEPVTFDDCCAVTRQLIDDDCLQDFVALDNWDLEVSSPGVNRPLRLLSHFKGVKGDNIEVKLFSEQGLERVFGKGRLLEVCDDGQIQVETSRGVWAFSIDQVERARLLYQWNDLEFDEKDEHRVPIS